MQQEIRFATFNLLNLALPGMRFYENIEPYTQEQYEKKVAWIARQLDLLDADVIGFQEVFSQAALKDVLTRTQSYQHAQHIGCDPDPAAERLTPSVALISRLPVLPGATYHSELPANLAIRLPDITDVVTRYTRPVLQARIQLSAAVATSVFVVHLKSKCPDYRDEEVSTDPSHFGIAVLRSLIRRGTEALGLRYLLNGHMAGADLPVIVMGDFNDVLGSVTTQLVTGGGRPAECDPADRLFDSYRLQSKIGVTRDVGYTHVHDGNYETIDHILVSAAFNPLFPHAIGEVVNVIHLNDHLALPQPETTDHGIVLARIRLFPDGAGPAAVSAGIS